MYIGYCKITLQLPENQSLKGKRQIIRSLIDKLAQRFKVVASEVANHDLWQLASLGIVSVGNDPVMLEKVLHQILDYIEDNAGDYVITDFKQSIDQVFES